MSLPKTARCLCAACTVLAFSLVPCPPASPWGGIAPAHAQVGPNKAERGPRFPWPSFMRFWNTRCRSGFEIVAPQYVNGRYIMPYGDSVSLVVTMQDDVVRSVSAIYADPNQMKGGLRWIKVVDSVITVGTYRWPEDRVAAVRQRFRAVTPTPARYVWQNSSFRRRQSEQTGWEFRLDFLSTPVFSQDE